MKTTRSSLPAMLLAALALSATVPCTAQEPSKPTPAAQAGTHYADAALGIAFDVPKGLSLYTRDNPGPLASRINSGTPLFLVNPSFTEENVNVKVADGISASDLKGFKDMLDQNPNAPLPQYKRVSVAMIKIGKNKDISAVEHVFMMKGNIMGKLRAVTFVLRNKGFTFTCATAVDRFDRADREFFAPLFGSMGVE